MKVIIETMSGRKGIKNFDSFEDYVDFMTKNSGKIKQINESDLPYSDKPVELPSVSKSDGWKQMDSSAFGDVVKEPVKADSLLPDGNQGVFKNNAKLEPSKPCEKADKVEEPKIDKAPIESKNNNKEKEIPQFKYEDAKSSEKDCEGKDCDKKESEKDCEGKDCDKKDKKSSINEARYPSDFDPRYYFTEYMVFVYMIMSELKYGEESYNKLKYFLTKKDKKFKNVINIVDSFMEHTQGKYPADTRIDALNRLLASKGIDTDMLDQARSTFYREEKNHNDSYDEEIAEALRIAGVELDEAVEEQANNEEDGEIDDTTGKMKLMEEPNNRNLFQQVADDMWNYCDENNILTGEDSYFWDGQKATEGDKVSNFENWFDELNDIDIEDWFYEINENIEEEEAESMIEPFKQFVKKGLSAWWGDPFEELKKMQAKYAKNKQAKDQQSAGKEPSQSNQEDENSEQLDETKPARYNQHLGKDKSFANISASRSNDAFEVPGMEREKQKQSESNNAKTEQLKKDIKDMGLSYIKTFGAWRDEGPVTNEESFLIPNITKEQALELGKKYGQYSVIFKNAGEETAYMYVTLDNDDFGKVDMEFDMSKPNKFSSVKEKDDELQPYSGYTGLKKNGKGYNLSYDAK